LLALPNLNDILLYHVLGVEVPASGVTNGAIVDPLSPTNSLKLTVNGSNVFVNQAQVNAPDLFADNGVVHSTNAVLLPYTTVADIAIGSPDHTTLVAAVIEARLLPALTDPLASLTVFAPTDAAFTAALNALNLTAAELLASPDLSDILLYHVLGEEVLSTDLSNGMLANPLNTTNTLKVTLDVSGVFVNQAQVTIPDLPADNGTVHVLDAVVLPSTTVADVAIGSPAHTTLVAAVIEARLLPALTNPFSSLTVFAPTDAAFTAALNELGLTAAQLLASASLSDILLYHVLGAEVLSTDLSNGMLATPLNSANTLKVTIDGSNVFVNQAQVTAANLPADNGTVHVLDGVVLPNTTVVDVALGSTAHTTLVTALIQEHLLPV
ncbi:MAG: fasciclin domain-containing protein, partial [Bacteroidota bacterium]